VGAGSAEEGAVDAGLDDLAVKPFQLDRLMVRVGGMLKVRHLEDEIARATAYMQELRKAASGCRKPPTLYRQVFGGRRR
jgi:DNA-binding response OmpR family regulator